VDCMSVIKELEELWLSRVGLFAKIKWKPKDNFTISYGIVKAVINKSLILVNKNDPDDQRDIPLLDIIDSSVSPLKKEGKA